MRNVRVVLYLVLNWIALHQASTSILAGPKQLGPPAKEQERPTSHLAGWLPACRHKTQKGQGRSKFTGLPCQRYRPGWCWATGSRLARVPAGSSSSSFPCAHNCKQHKKPRSPVMEPHVDHEERATKHHLSALFQTIPMILLFLFVLL